MESRFLATAAVAISIASAAVAQHLVIQPNYGEPNGTFPNWQERVVAELTNRARSAPATDLAGCASCAEKACYSATAPVPWRYELNQSARFHSATMGMFPFFAHDTPCVLFTDIATRYPGTSDGSFASSCSGSGTTPAGTRVAYFAGGAGGENIAAGFASPFSVFYNQWLYEPTGDASCGFHGTLDNGHRYNILTNGPALGVGYQFVSGAPYGGFYWTMDFGGGPAIPKIPSGSHWTSVNHTRDPQGMDSTVEFWANWYDAAAPIAATVVLDGVPQTMTLGRGSVTNGAYSYSAAGLSAACHNYYFQFTSASLAIVRYPDTGTLGFGNSGCSDWQNTAAPPPATNVVATATSSTSVQVTWSGSCATLCRVYRSRFNDKSTFDLAGTGVSPFTDLGVASGRAYLYKVRAFNGIESVDSNVNLANTTTYTNTIAPGSIVRAVDINQMRDAVDAVRTLAGMTAGTYTYGSGSPARIAAGTVIRAADILELRANLDAAWFGLFSLHLSFTNNIVAGSSVVRAIDFNEIRGAMQ
jgi:uncharacterized protein YkwD